MDLTSRALLDSLETDLTPVLRSNLEFQEQAALSLRRSLFKKFEDEATTAADDAALAKFATVNERCKQFKFDQMHEWEWMVLGELRAHMYSFFFPTGDGQILNPATADEAMAGPGASIGARGEDFYTKHFDSTLTYTHKGRFLRDVYSRALSSTTYWKSAEILRQTRYGDAIVRGSRLSCVPKNVDISRTTCTEPSLNMFFQKGLGCQIENRLREWGVDLALQPDVNRGLARKGSLDGSFGTIDLASASDSLSIGMMRWVLPQPVFLDLWLLRCDEAQLPNGNWTELHMLSTMGNGYTFALQTALFAGVVLAVYKCLGLPARKRCDGIGDTWGVFGDDIIVDERAYNLVCRILQLLGFEVNSEKSFNTGPFRESCGTDWYLGVDIRGVYCKSLATVGARFSLVNRLLAWSARHGILLRETVGLLLRNVPCCKVPLLEQEDSGVRVPATEIDPFRAQRSCVRYLKYEPHVPKLRWVDDGFKGPLKSGIKQRRTNEYGVVVAILQGSIDNGVIALRARKGSMKYHRCRGRTHYWDSLTRVTVVDDHGPMRGLRFEPVMTPAGWQCWSSTVRMHIVSVRMKG